MSVVFLFPGQGTQRPGMLHELPSHPAIQATLHEASEILNMDVLELDTQASLETTDHVQLALCISGVAVARALQEEGVKPAYVAGHSAGAFAAAVISGAITLKDTLPLVRLRGEGMMTAYPEGYGMGVVTGLLRREVEVVVNQIHTEENPVYISNLNAPTQISIAGKLEAIDTVLAVCLKNGARKAIRLNMNVPSHCKLLDPVSLKLTEAIGHIQMNEPLIPYAGNVRGRVLRTANDIGQDLATNIAHPVRWDEVSTLIYELGGRLFLEMPPGQVLSDLAREAFAEARTAALQMTSLESAVVLSERYSDGV
ncbi:malonate decarboxylase subunit epsilon [Paenibacillus sp. ClWae2A]|uniref:ACP S-malonyltransferase n=1 Tax=Paenibacillus sp. ClWae2A TaxID=3057177 RepID=UPI0028F4FCD6|nr:malonate decarboxylase subunit epsilon [Paenibacillus sp. ClWae2A]MDT9719977.1 malonate decarboxylase subunit epsilon [Paenibacillus sp. ClWae2A]